MIGGAGVLGSGLIGAGAANYFNRDETVIIEPQDSEYPLLPYIEERGWHNPPGKSNGGD